MPQLHAITTCEARGGCAKGGVVLTIIDQTATPHLASRDFAEAAWRSNPKLAPNWWRENLGETHSKFACDTRIGAPESLSAALNLAVVSAEQPMPPGVLQLVVTTNPAMPATNIVLPTEGLDEPALAQAFQQLEARVAHGSLKRYGIWADDLASPAPHFSLQRLLELAASAAEVAWGRKKRPALQIIMAPLDVLNWGLLLTANTQHKGQAVSSLEQASRLGLMVLAVPQAWPAAEATQQPPAAALQALAHVAQAEVALHQQLRGQWPHLAEQPVFSVMKILNEGLPPFPHASALLGWHQHSWPLLQQALQGLPQAENLLQAWQQLIPHLPALAAAAAAPLALQALEMMQLPAPWQGLPAHLQQLAVLASVPGISAVLVPPTTDLAALHNLPDFPDLGALLAR